MIILAAFTAGLSTANADELTGGDALHTCQEGDTKCTEYLETLKKLHFEKHISQARGATQTAETATAVSKKTLAAALATAEMSLAAASKSQIDASVLRDAERQRLREKNSPGLVFKTAMLKSADKVPVTCNALPYVRFSCAIRSDCTDDATKDIVCPRKFSCRTEVKNKPICNLPENATGPIELWVTYSCNGVTQPDLIASDRATFAYISCDQR